MKNNPNVIVSSDYGSIIVNVHDSAIGKHIIDLGYWAIDDVNLIKELISIQLENLDTISFYDVGSNIGTHSLAVSKTFGDKITIRAFEAQRQIYNMMCGTMAINNITNVRCHLNAISAIANEEIKIHLPDYNQNNNFGSLELVPPIKSDNHGLIKSNFELIKTTTIDSFEERVDFIKMDIEGMEDKALLGGVNTIEQYRPIVFIEIIKSDSPFIQDFFKNRNYHGFRKGYDLIAIPIEYKLDLPRISRIF